jgi:phage/plasmid-associated DNA primase
MERILKDFIPFDEEQMEYMETIRKRFFNDVLGEQLGDYYILQLARGLMGDLMKKFLFGLGTTDCGKSVLTQALKKSLGGYYGDFNAENLVYTKNSADEAAKMRWALLLRYKRIIISNEMKTNTTINGNMLKKVSSGGDGLTGRQHCGNETAFTPHFLVIAMANDIPKIVPYDSAVDNRVRVISYKKKFVDEVEDKENELLKDNDIEKEINTDEFQAAFLMMLIKRYVDFKDNGDIQEPDEVINGKKEWIEETGDVMDLFLNDFEITNDENDYLPSEDIKLWLSEKKIGISSTKIAIEIKKYCKNKKYDNVNNKYKKVNKRSIMVWFGIKAFIDNYE